MTARKAPDPDGNKSGGARVDIKVSVETLEPQLMRPDRSRIKILI